MRDAVAKGFEGFGVHGFASLNPRSLAVAMFRQRRIVRADAWLNPSSSRRRDLISSEEVAAWNRSLIRPPPFIPNWLSSFTVFEGCLIVYKKSTTILTNLSPNEKPPG
jgi:hypothetical protein